MSTLVASSRDISWQQLPEKLLLVDDLPVTATGSFRSSGSARWPAGSDIMGRWGRARGKNSTSAEVRAIMTTLTDRTITALRATHDDLATLVSDLSEDQLHRTSGATDWTVAQVLSHLGSGAEIALAVLTATIAGTTAPGEGVTDPVWDRWNAMKPPDQAAGYIEHDTRLITTYEALSPQQRETLQIDLGFLPAPLPVAAVAGMRLSETAQHSWDVRVAVDPDATIPGYTAQLMAEHLAGDLRFMTGFIGRTDALAAPAVVEIADSGFGIVIADSVSLTQAVPTPTATFVGPLEAAIRLIGGRLTVAHTPAAVEVTGNPTLDDLRKVFPGY
jgi:uncharacterized protein (TIGR03083 family)